MSCSDRKIKRIELSKVGIFSTFAPAYRAKPVGKPSYQCQTNQTTIKDIT